MEITITMKQPQNKNKQLFMYTLHTLVIISGLMLIPSLTPAFATHISSKGIPSWGYTQALPQSGCSADGKRCAQANVNGFSYDYAKATSAFETVSNVYTRENSNLASNQVGSPPQVIIGSATELAFDVVNVAHGTHTQPSGSIARFFYGGETWKLVSGSYQKDVKFNSWVDGNGNKDVVSTLRYKPTNPLTPAGTWREGAVYQAWAQNPTSAATTIVNWYTPTSSYYIYTGGLNICHITDFVTPCP